MLNDEKRGVEESYTSAMTTSDMRVEADVRGDADVIIAAGMNKSRLGAALLRLHTEFDRSARPKKPSRPQIEAIAIANPKEVATGKVNGDGTPGTKWVPNFRQAETTAWGWYEAEARAVLMRLKSLPEVRDQMVQRAVDERLDRPERIAPQVIAWWLMQQCHVCHGVQEEVVIGTGRLSGRVCSQCKGAGKSQVPGGPEGRRLANIMDECVQAARDSISKRLRAYSHHT